MDAFEREIELIENDDTLSEGGKQRLIRELEVDYRLQAEEAAQEAYENELNNW